ncbi:MAG: EAL domain-containing protein [Hydrogenovibrio crunogenus]|uniref:Response regulator receiver (CheY-like) modulated diguanylate phosphodiesterase (EAL domain) n=1 Tax=Hydrogenovibrio crunogenus (strain DSM 25203 / XCL-2) TaxID=317025 RepID=Q31J50_HYDCU|nr:EAL domain-containing protein [Hydrogenovibrio crunogenus]
MDVNALIIDDERSIAELICSVAELVNVPCHIVTDATTIKESDLQNINLIFLDLWMPDKDGIEVLGWLQQQEYSGCLVLMSGVDSSVLMSAEGLASAYGIKVIGHLNKPFDVKEVQTLIKKAQEISHKDFLEQSSLAMEEKLMTPPAIQKALDEDRVTVFYQPQVDLNTQRVVGFEALVRILSPENDVIYPNRFLSVAEEHGLIHDITSRVVDQALGEFTELLNKYGQLTLSINLSTQDLEDLKFADWLYEKVDELGIPRGKIIFEISGIEKLPSYSLVVAGLSRLRLKGFKVSLDYFGAGNVTLEQVQTYPITELKIDPSFAVNIMTDEKSAILIKSTLQMCHALDLDVVVIGVESEAIAAQLKLLGARIVQGYWYSRSLSFEKTLEFLEQNEEAMPVETVNLCALTEQESTETEVKLHQHEDSPPHKDENERVLSMVEALETKLNQSETASVEEKHPNRDSQSSQPLDTDSAKDVENTTVAKHDKEVNEEIHQEEESALAQSKIKLGKATPRAMLTFILPLTGKFSFIGNSQKFGMILAYLAAFEERRTDCYIGLEFYDDASALDQFYTYVEKHISSKSIGIIGPSFSLFESEGFAKKTAGSKLPIIGSFNSCDDLRKPNAKGLYNFKPGVSEEINLILDRLKDNGNKSLCIIPKTRVNMGLDLIRARMDASEIISYDMKEFNKVIQAVKKRLPNKVFFFGSARAMVKLIEEVNDENIQYYTTSLAGTGMLKKLLSRQGKLNVMATSPLPDLHGDTMVAKLFRSQAKERRIPSKFINIISFEAYLVTKLVLDLYIKHNQDMNAKQLKKALENLFSYDLGLDYPVSWAQETRQLLHHIYLNKL